MPNPVLEATRARRARTQTRLDDLGAEMERRGSLTPETSAEFDRLMGALNSDDADIAAMESEERRLGACSRASAEVYAGRGGKHGAYIASEPMTYSADPRGPSFFKDIAALAQQGYSGEREESMARFVPAPPRGGSRSALVSDTCRHARDHQLGHGRAAREPEHHRGQRR